jgi:hypothetical protein
MRRAALVAIVGGMLLVALAGVALAASNTSDATGEGTAATTGTAEGIADNAVIVETPDTTPITPFSPDGELLVALIDKTHVLTAVAFSPDGELLA